MTAETNEVRAKQVGDPDVQSLLSGVNCSGSEERLADCDHDGVDLTYTNGCSWDFVKYLQV